jgi:glycosyltransferase involved in cell wall biosynthesis
MKILWMNWKDLANPLAGGAEVVNEELATRLVRDGHQVTFLVAGFAGGAQHLKRKGFTIIRVGTRWSVYWQAFHYYQQHLRGWADVVIDEINTIPFFAQYYVKEKTLLFVHMLCREIWWYQLHKSLGLIGYLLEPVYLRLLNSKQVVTVSQSTKDDLLRQGFKADNIHIISEGLEFAPAKSLDANQKRSRFTLLSLGSIRPMKRTLDQIQAFELARDQIPELQLKIAGDANNEYGSQVLDYIKRSRYQQDMEYLGKVSLTQKKKLMLTSHLFLMTSVKEGWGLTVTEAASQGTPSVVYNVDGLKDSVIHEQTGIIVQENTPASLGQAINELYAQPKVYHRYQRQGWEWSKRMTFDQSYQDFSQILQAYV